VGSTQPPVYWAPRVQRPACEALSSAEFKNEWNHTSTPLCFDGTDRDNYTSIIIIIIIIIIIVIIIIILQISSLCRRNEKCVQTTVPSCPLLVFIFRTKFR